MWLTRFALNRPVITALVFGALAIFGFISFTQLGRSANPPGTDFPVVVVIANYPGASPDEMERLIVKPIEDQLDGMDKVDQVTASAQEGTASVVVQFNIDSNLDLSAIDVQRRVDTARAFMPADLDPPIVEKNGAGQPLMDLAISSKTLSDTALNDMVTNRVEPLLKAIPNIEQVNIYGGRKREFQLEPQPVALYGMGATLGDVFNTVSQNNANLPGGRLITPTQEASVSVHADIVHASDMLGIPLAVPGGAQKTATLGNVATALDGYAEQRTISHYNGEPRLYVELQRTIASDEIKSTQIARDQLKTIEAQFPQLAFNEIDAPADYTTASLNGVWQSLFEGVFLTMIVMMLFLHAWRNAVVVMVSIPVSILSTFIVMKFLGFHLDMMSMMGLSLIIGILVDDSIVVLENITRHRDLGEDPLNAAINGRTEIGSAAVAITMVDVVVFLPVGFLSGIVGKYLKEYALVVVIATLMSLFVSFTLTPLLAGRWSVLRRSMGTPAWMAFFKKLSVNFALLGAAVVLMVGPEVLNFAHIKIPSALPHLLAIFIVALLILNAFVQRYDAILDLYRNRLLPLALRHGYFVFGACALLLLNALMLSVGGWRPFIVVDGGMIVVLAAALGLSYVLGGFAEKRIDLAPASYKAAPRLLTIFGSLSVGGFALMLFMFIVSIVAPSGIVSAIMGLSAALGAIGIVLAALIWLPLKMHWFRPTARPLAGGNILTRAGGSLGVVVQNGVSTIARSVALARKDPMLVARSMILPAILLLTMPWLGKLSTDFVPSTQTGSISMTVTYPPGTPIATTSHFVHNLETTILRVDGIKSVSSTVGRKPFGWGSAVGSNYAQLNATTQDDRRKETNDIIEKVRKLSYAVPGGELQVAGEGGGGSGATIFYSLAGPEDQIGPAAEKVATFLRNTKGSVNIQSSNEVAAPRLNIQVNAAQAAVLGVSPGAAAEAARIAVDGAVATKVRTAEGLVDVRVQFPAAYRTAQNMNDVRVRAADGTLVPLSSIATFTWTKAPTKIDRLNRQRVVNVLGDILPGFSLGAVTAPLEAKLKEPGFLPPGVALTAQGDTQYMQQTMTDMGIALATSFMLVYMLMVVLYGSFLEPLIVMFSVPMAIVGALAALAFMNTPLINNLLRGSGQSINLISMLGIIMLFGLVAKNGILLVDYSNTLCKRGMRVKDAVVSAAGTRFRPILMTTFAMVFGMLPLAIGLAEGAEWRQSMGTVIIGGLLSSLILTLFLVPMIYNTWIGFLERRADERAVRTELQPRDVGEPVLAH